MTLYVDMQEVVFRESIYDERGRPDGTQCQIRHHVEEWLKEHNMKYHYHPRYISGVITFEDPRDLFIFKLSFNF